MPTSTPPPYFPQSSLSPTGSKAGLKRKLLLFGCAAFSLLLLAGFVVGTISLIRWLF
jgi:hypothetical protein